MSLFPIRPCPLPEQALLGRYATGGAYTDCFMTDISMPVSQAQFVTAFYTTSLFKLERFILTWTVAKPSTDAQVQQLADGSINTFAAWTVEARSQDQLLMCDYQSLTRSWLMVLPLSTGTRLYFGSAVVPRVNARAGKATLGLIFYLLLGFHRLYSVALLYAARLRLEKLYQ